MVLIRPVHVSSASFLFYVRFDFAIVPRADPAVEESMHSASQLSCRLAGLFNLVPLFIYFLLSFLATRLYFLLWRMGFSKYVAAVQDDLSKLGLVPGDNRRHFLLLFGFTLKASPPSRYT